MSLQKTYERYSPLLNPGELTPEDFARVDAILRETSAEQMNAWTDARMRTYELFNGQRFRMLVDEPDDYDPNQVVIVAGEYGKGTDPDHIMRAKVVRDMAAPQARLIYQPTATADHPRDNMNFSDDERRQLRLGSLDPLMGRFALVLDGDVPTQTVYGSSQGGTVALGYGADGDTPPAAVTVFEPPNVVKRPIPKLMLDFLGNSGQLAERFRENNDDPDSIFIEDILAAQSLGAFVKFGRGLIVPESRAMLTLMCQGDAEQNMKAILRKGGSVVHVYGTKDKVSPEADNVTITQNLESDPSYRGVRLPGVGHEGSILYAVNGSLARIARERADWS